IQILGLGIGRSIVTELVKQGAHVIALSLTKKNLETLKNEQNKVLFHLTGTRQKVAKKNISTAMG
ncbi:hypothetical protein NPIL_498741, partial [Nephila pilipes]